MTTEAGRSMQSQTMVDASVALPAVSREKADYLLETIVCGAFDSAIQVAALTILLNEYARTGAISALRSFRHLLVDDSKVMLFALSYGEDIGLKTAVVASLTSLYREIATAKDRLSSRIEAGRAGTVDREGAQGAAQSWRGLAEEASKAIEQLREAARTRLNEVYQHDGQTARRFLQQALDGDRGVFDEAGALRLPEAKQRRRLPRLAIRKPCTLILPSGVHRAQLEDVALQGFAVVSSAPLAVGDAVTVGLQDGRKLTAKVARRQGDKVGLRLAVALSQSDPLFGAAAVRG